MSANKLLINLNDVIENIEYLRQEKEVCLMVKANAYGIGLEIIPKLIEKGYKYYGVSTIEEALSLRKVSEEIEILIVSYISTEDLPRLRTNNIQFSVFEQTILEELEESDKFHLNIDTGMGRLGFKVEELEAVGKYLLQRAIKPLGIYTHLPIATDEEFTEKQITEFEKVVTSFPIEVPYIHIYNSLGAAKYSKETSFDNLVRIGLGIWGYLEDEEFAKNQTPLKPAIELKTTISLAKNYNGRLSYGLVDEVNGYVYTIPIGYNDGFRRSFRHFAIKNLGEVVGTICMCQSMILSDNKQKFNKDDQVTLFKGDDFYEVARYSETSLYEIFTSLSERIQRIYQERKA